ncbi:MAG: SDR family NAD(P)-dependent oxidoreductase [Anaerolineaceae bacterium]|nr:SDR family NAD(P)-dependent oxidoreductase [Anaerolineaceae bacterium]
MRLLKRIALITGAATGIGRACAEAYANEGAELALIDINPETGESTAKAIRDKGGQAVFYVADMADPQAVQMAVEKTHSQYGRIDILVSNAGIGGRKFGDGPVHLCTPEAWDKIMSVNLRGTFLVNKYVLPVMMEQSSGCIITIASVLGLVGTQGLFDTHAYSTSKAGIIGLTRDIAAHYARNGIRANCIAPGLIDTQMANRTKSDPKMLEQVAFWQPLGPLGSVSDVASAAVFLGSDESRFITGVTLPVDGGWTAQ